jgi:hypothetical protein
MKILVTGISSGLGKYLHKNLLDSDGLDRENFNDVKNKSYDLIIHCAFNKEKKVTDYKKYLQDNILLTNDLKKINHKKFIYISTVDIYSDEFSFYTEFKKFAETLIEPNDLILRCSMILGDDMKDNHLTKIYRNYSEISLSSESNFNYILMDEILYFIRSSKFLKHCGIIDFVSKDSIKLEDLKKYFNSETRFGNYTYRTLDNFPNPIWKLDEEFNVSCLDKIKKINL